VAWLSELILKVVWQVLGHLESDPGACCGRMVARAIRLLLHRLGRWMRLRMLGSEQAAAGGDAGTTPSAQDPKHWDSFLGAAMVVCVAVVALVVLKRPSALRGLLRRCRHR
jgi:hypothetical protein